MKKEFFFDLKLISILLLIVFMLIFFSGVLQHNIIKYDCFTSNGSITRLDYINVVSIILIIISLFETIINVLIIISKKSTLFVKILFILFTIMFSIMFVFQLYILRDNFVCGKEEVALIE